MIVNEMFLSKLTLTSGAFVIITINVHATVHILQSANDFSKKYSHVFICGYVYVYLLREDSMRGFDLPDLIVLINLYYKINVLN